MCTYVYAYMYIGIRVVRANAPVSSMCRSKDACRRCLAFVKRFAVVRDRYTIQCRRFSSARRPAGGAKQRRKPRLRGLYRVRAKRVRVSRLTAPVR